MLFSEGRSRHPNLSEGGAFQISLSKLQVDVYPYHLADSSRSTWIRYSESVHSTWLNNSIIAFQNSLLEALTSSSSSNASGSGGSSGNKAPLSRSAPGSQAPTVSFVKPVVLALRVENSNEAMISMFWKRVVMCFYQKLMDKDMPMICKFQLCSLIMFSTYLDKKNFNVESVHYIEHFRTFSNITRKLLVNGRSNIDLICESEETFLTC